MIARLVALLVLLAASPAMAQTMNAEAAKRFVTGKLFAFNCIDGSRGLGRNYVDGSVNRTVQINGSGPMKSVWLPPGTLRASISPVPAGKPSAEQSTGSVWWPTAILPAA